MAIVTQTYSTGAKVILPENIVPGSVSYVAAGGGGGGGGGDVGDKKRNTDGGAGGTAGVTSGTLNVAGGTTLNLTVGTGGSGGTAGASGASGGDTRISVASERTIPILGGITITRPKTLVAAPGATGGKRAENKGNGKAGTSTLGGATSDLAASGGSGAASYKQSGTAGEPGFIILTYEVADPPPYVPPDPPPRPRPPDPPPPPPPVTLYRSASSISEGEEVTFTIYTNGISTGTLISYSISGVNADDLLTGSLSGNFVVGISNSVSYRLKSDTITEGTETLVITLPGYGLSSQCDIIDTSTAPVDTYSIIRSSASVNEGDVVTFTLITTGVPDDTTVSYNIVGVVPADLNFALLNGNFIVEGNTSTIGFNITSDLFQEGLETFSIELINGRASATVTINDTSIPPRHIYVKEQGQYREIEKVYYKQDGVWFPIRKIYTKFEGVWRKVFDKEAWSVMLSLVGASESSTTWNAQANATLTMTFTSIDEAKYFFNTGGKLKFTSRLENGSPTMQNSEWSNLLAASGVQEFSGFWKDEFNYYKLTDTYQTMYTHVASVPYTANYYKIEAKCNLADNTLGGATEVMFRFIWRDDYARNYIGWNNHIYAESGVDGVLSITVEEIKAVAPSTEPVVNSPSYVLSSISYDNVIVPTLVYSVVPRVSSIDEGQSITFDVTTSNYGSGTMYYTIVSGNNDVSPVQGPITITDNAGVFTVSAVADLITEGSETFYVELRRNQHETVVIATSSVVTINDTSLTLPTFSITPQTLSVNEGSSIVFDVATTNYLSTTLYYTTTGVASGDVSPTSGTITLVSEAATITVTAGADVSTEGAETFRIQLRTDSTSGPIVATSTSVIINDTSVTPPPAYEIVPNRYSGNESGTGVSFTILTANVPTGTMLYYTIIGSSNLTAADFTDSASTGSFTIINNYGTVYKEHTPDAISEGVEAYYMQVRTGSTAGPVVATSSTVTINDTSTATYAFTVNHTGCTTGNAYAGRGQPGDYTSAIYGQVIWPVSGNNQWVGVAIIPTTSTITVKTTCDNAFSLYHNQGNYIGAGDNWGVWYTFTINVTPNVPNYISLYCQDFGGLYGISCRITDANGEILSLSNTSWVSS